MRKYNLSMHHAGLVALIALLCVLPFFLGRYHCGLTTLLFINIILALSFRLVLAAAGWNLCQRALMGTGAYASAIMAKDFGWPFWVTLPLGGLVTALVGLVLSYPLRRMRGWAFLIASFALGEVIRLSWMKLDYPFGGPSGLTGIPSPSSWSIPGLPIIDFHQEIPYYFLVLVVMLVSAFIMYRIHWSRLGDTFRAIAAYDTLAESVGINIARYKSLAFVIGAFFAGLAGALMAHYLGVIDPSLFSLWPLIILLAWLAVGGTTTFAGPIVGTVLFVALAEVLRPFAAWRPLVYGFVLIGVLLFMPEGLEGLPAKASLWVKRLRRRIRRT